MPSHTEHAILKLLLALRRQGQEELEQGQEQLRQLGRILVKEDQALALLARRPLLTKASVSIMPKTIAVGERANATIQAFDQFGNPFPLTGLKVQYTASDPNPVSFGDVQADGSDTITAVAVDADPGDQIGANITRADGTVITATPDVLIITTPPPPVPVLTTAKVVLS